MYKGNVLQKQATTLQYQWVSHNRTYSKFRRSPLISTKSKLNQNLLTDLHCKAAVTAICSGRYYII